MFVLYDFIMFLYILTNSFNLYVYSRYLSIRHWAKMQTSYANYVIQDK